MKILFLIPLFIWLSLAANAQEKFIEVTVSDTAWVKPDNFIYRITVNRHGDLREDDTLQYSDAYAYKQKMKTMQDQNKQLLDSVTKFIRKNGFHILPPTLREAVQYLGDNEFKSYSVDVLTGSVDSLKILYALISKNTALFGALENSFAKNEIPYFQILYKKLLLQAQKKAVVMAELSGRKAGRVISVREAKDKNSGGWSVYPPLSSVSDSVIPGWHTTIQSKNDYMISNDEIITDYLIYDELVVRFAFE